jgi:hypothetical protein
MLSCYFAFSFANKTMATLRDFLRAIAYQSAMQDAFVRTRFLKMAEETVAWDKSDEKSIWRRLFVGVVFQSPLISRHVWVIDGIDQCPNINTLFTKFLSTIPPALRVFATSRSSGSITQGLAILGSCVCTHAISADDTSDDIRLFIESKLLDTGCFDSKVEGDVIRDKILRKSQGSFLLAKLVTQQVQNAWTRQQMESILQQIPSFDNVNHHILAILEPDPHKKMLATLDNTYHRILKSIELDPHKKMLAKSILTWVSLASRPLTVDELRFAIQLDVNQTIQNVAKSIPSLCGQLVHVDGENRVQMMHATMRQFLLSKDLDSDLAVQRAPANTRLALLLVRYLSGIHAQRSPLATSTSARSAIESSSDSGLLAYATSFFSDHIYSSTSEDDALMGEICSFLKSRNVLSWIERIARAQDFSILTRTATNLRGYMRRRVKYLPPIDPHVQLVNGWVIDLMRVAAKFQLQLAACPSAIYQLIPPLCPPHSNIARTFASNPRLSPLVVKTLQDGGWDDCLIRIDFSNVHATAVSHGDECFAVSLSNGHILLYSASSFQKLRDFKHPEGVQILQLSQGGDYLLACGKTHITAWSVETGVSAFTGRHTSVPLSAVFMSDDELLITSQTSEITRL